MSDLHGAGFTIFLVSELTKIKNGDIQPAFTLEEGFDLVDKGTLVKDYDEQKLFVGYKYPENSPEYNALTGDRRLENHVVYVPDRGFYWATDILEAYKTSDYSNEVKKWGLFDNETQAIARGYYDSKTDIAAINADYKHIPNHQGPNNEDDPYYGVNGLGAGLERSSDVKSRYAYATNTTNDRTDAQTSYEYALSELFVNNRGEIKTPPMPWGSYIVVETTIPKDKQVIDPFFVTVSDTSDDVNLTTAYTKEDVVIREKLILVKRDAQTGQDILLANTKFRIWSYNDQKYVSQMESGTAGIVTRSTVFSTDATGRVKDIDLQLLQPGKYRLEEIDGPNGFWNAYWDYGNPSSENNLFTDKLGSTSYVVDAKQNQTWTNDPNGNVRTDDGTAINEENMKTKYFGTVDFEVTTERKFRSAALVSDNMTTDDNNDILYIGESYHNSETLGMLTILKTGEVLVGYDKTSGIEYRDEYQAVDANASNQDKTYKTRESLNENVEEFDIATDRDSTQNGLGASYDSEYFGDDALTEASFNYDDELYDFVYEERPLANATFQVIAAEDIYTQDRQTNADGSRTTWFKKGDVVATLITARDGEILDAVPNYVEGGQFVSTDEITGEKFVQNYTTAEFHTSGRIENKWIESKMSALDIAIFGVPSFKDELIYPNSYKNEAGEQQVVVRVIKDGTLGQVSILLPLGKYTIKEIEAPYGYVLPEYSEFDADKVSQSIDVEFTWKDQIKEIVFNTNTESVADTKAKIDSFVARNLAWWHGGVNEYTALNNEAINGTYGVNVDQVLRDIARKEVNEKYGTLADKRGTYTDKYLFNPDGTINAPTIIGDAELQYYKDEEGFINFYNERVKPYADKEKSKKYLSVGIYKVDAEDEDRYLAGAKFGLYTADDIYSVDGKLLVPADTRLAVATTNEDGFAEFEVDIPYASKHYANTPTNDKELYADLTVEDGLYLSIDGNTALNSGKYYIKELVPPVGFLYNDQRLDVEFVPMSDDDSNHDKQLLYPVYTTNTNKGSEVLISKRDIVNQDEIAGAELEVYEVLAKDGGRVTYTEEGAIDWTKNELSDVIDSWTTVAGETHVIRELELSNREIARLDNDEVREHVYLLREVKPAAGYTTATDIVFEVVQDYEIVDGKINWKPYENNTVWVLNETTVDYIDGVIKAQPYYTDHEGSESEYNYSHDYYYYTNDKANSIEIISDEVANDIVNGNQPGKAIVNWTVVNGTLIIDIENDATIEAIEHAFSAKRISEALDMVSPDASEFFAEHKAIDSSSVDTIYIVPNENVSDEIVEAVKDRLFKEDSEEYDNPFSEDMLVETLDETTAKLLDAEELAKANPTVKVVQTFEWAAVNDDVYNTEQKIATETNGEKLDLKPAVAYERTIVMEDERTKVYISKADIANDKEVPGAHIVVKDVTGEVVEEWDSTGEDHYFERLPIGKYTLEETQAPNADGYVKTSTIEFEVEDNGHINTVYMPDNYTRVKITKTDIVTGERVENAKLQIVYLGEEDITYKDEVYHTNDTIVSWVTKADEDYYIDRLPTGQYKVIETYAPNEYGYVQSNEIEFEIVDEDVVTKVDMKDDFTVTEISKTDLVTGDEVPGAKLEVYKVDEKTVEKVDENGDVIIDLETGEPKTETVIERNKVVSWTTGDKNSVKTESKYSFIHGDVTSDGKIVFEYLPVGNYELVEKLPADGYTTANTVEFEVVDKLYHYENDAETIKRDANGDVIPNEAEIIKAEMKDDYTVARFSKTDSVTGEEIFGAFLEVYEVETDTNGDVVYEDMVDENGNVVKDENGNAIKVAKRVDSDTTIEGIQPAYSWISGYKEAANGDYKVVDGKIVVATENDGTLVKDADENGKALPHVIERIPIGKYVLVETQAPDGYIVAEEVVFEVKDFEPYHYTDTERTIVNEVDGAILPNEDAVVKVNMVDERALLISKRDIVTDEEVEGAVLALYEYVADDVIVPVQEDTLDGVTPDDVSGNDVSGNDAVEPVVIKHDYSKDEPIITWTSGKAPYGIDMKLLEYDTRYVLHEVSAPSGYFVAEDITFKLEKVDGTVVPAVKIWDAKTEEWVDSAEKNTVIMVDDTTVTRVHKLETTSGGTNTENYVSGATLAIYKVNKVFGIKVPDWSNPVAAWTTEGKSSLILHLEPGDYVLHEVNAPSGYKKADDIYFTITEDNKSNNPVELKMYDQRVAGDSHHETTPTPTPTVTPSVTPTVTPTPTEQIVTPLPVQTGDTNNVLPYVLGGVLLLGIGCATAFMLVKKKDDESKDDNQSKE